MSFPKSIKLSEETGRSATKPGESLHSPPNSRGLLVVWDDDHQSFYPFPFLRKACPCAVCKGERTPLDMGPLALPVLKDMPASAFMAQDLFKVGRYAIGFRWGDGHDTGIYTFDYLRSACPCEKCINPDSSH